MNEWSVMRLTGETAGQTEPLHTHTVQTDHQEVHDGGEDPTHSGEEEREPPAEDVAPAAHEAVHQQAGQGIADHSHLG